MVRCLLERFCSNLTLKVTFGTLRALGPLAWRYVPKRKIMKILLATIMLLVSANSNAVISDYYEHYAPIRHDGRSLVVAQDLYTKEHFDKVEFVLEFNFRKYVRVSDTKIELDKPMDKDFMWNMTTKAEDPAWMERQGKLWKSLQDQSQ